MREQCVLVPRSSRKAETQDEIAHRDGTHEVQPAHQAKHSRDSEAAELDEEKEELEAGRRARDAPGWGSGSGPR